MNLKILAQDLGMSKTTVSRALNGYPEVNVRTRERVMAAAKEAGYEANPVARMLAMGRTNTIGVIYPLQAQDLGDGMFLGLVGGMSAILEDDRKSMMIVPVSPKKELTTYEQMVRHRRVDGLVVCRTLVQDERIAFLVKKGFPFVAHGRTALNTPYAWFDYDNEAGLRKATQRLLELGHKRIALVSSPLELNFAQQRKQSFLATMANAGLSVDPRNMIEGSLDRRSGHQSMQTLLSNSERPTAVIVDNHLAGVGAVRALLDSGLVLGKDMSIIVWGSIQDSLVGPDVSTIDQPHGDKAGATMVTMLNSLIAGTPAAELQVLWQPTLLEGATIGRCPA